MEDLKNNILTKEQIHYSTDDIIWEILIECKQHDISYIIEKLINYKKYLNLTNNISSNPDNKLEIDQKESNIRIYKPKFRGIDPWVMFNNKLVRLTEIDQDFKAQYEKTKNIIEQGFKINFGYFL